MNVAQKYWNSFLRTTAAAAMLWAVVMVAADQAQITVQVDKPGHRVPSTLWGIFFEDINCSADGGIYAELVRNRSLEDSDKPDHWTVVTTGAGIGNISVSLEQPMDDDLLSERNRWSYFGG